MLFTVDHQINFKYSQEVFLEPMVVRLKPRTDPNQRLLKFDLKIDPSPEGLSEVLDLEGSSSSSVWFSGKISRLSLRARSQTQTLRANPFDYILPEGTSMTLPLEYSSPWIQPLNYYRQTRYPSPLLRDFSKEILQKSKGRTQDYLNTLTQTIHERFDKEKREDGPHLKPHELIEEGSGACRDLSVLFMEACRHLGMGARYVSGYTRGDDRVLLGELHAWAEVYLPGGGWRGFDPTLGLAVADQHVALTSCADPEITLPTTGTFRGTGASAQMDYEVKISVEEDKP